MGTSFSVTPLLVAKAKQIFERRFFFLKVLFFFFHFLEAQWMGALAGPAGCRLSLECGRDEDFFLIHIALYASQLANSLSHYSLHFPIVPSSRLSFILFYDVHSLYSMCISERPSVFLQLSRSYLAFASYVLLAFYLFTHRAHVIIIN